MLLAAGLALAAGRAAVAADQAHEAPTAYAGAETCAACHQAEYDEWKGSRHAGAFSSAFQSFRRAAGDAPECLACHTTGYDPARGTYAFAGVGCESCHGAMTPDHPESPSMVLPTEVSVCAACHRQTYLEWQLSGHAKKHVRCFDCHAVHRQGLRLPGAEAQCGACHAQRMEDFAHATHHQQGLTCTTCHMPKPKTSGVGGTGAPAHSFFVGAETCAACHEDMVHRSHKLGTLSAEVDRLSQTEVVKRSEQLHTRVRELELALDVQRSKTLRAILAALMIGLLSGAGLLAWMRRGARRPPPPPP